MRLLHYVCMPSPLPRQVRWNRFAQYCSIVIGLPHITVGSAPALHFSRPAQRSLTLQPADSPSRLMRPSTPEAPTALLPPPPLRLLPGGAIQFPGGPFLPLWSSAFHGALQSPGLDSYVTDTAKAAPQGGSLFPVGYFKVTSRASELLRVGAISLRFFPASSMAWRLP